MRHFAGQTLSYTSEVMFTAHRQSGELLAACAKQQAQFESREAPGKFGRINFP